MTEPADSVAARPEATAGVVDEYGEQPGGDAEPREYCVVHDRPIDWCKTPERCRNIMKGWGLYPDDSGSAPADAGP